MEMSERRAKLLEAIADSCRRELNLETAKKDSADEFNTMIKELKKERERLLDALQKGADLTELPFDVDTPYPMQDEEEEVPDPDPTEADFEDAPTDPDIDPGNFFDAP